MNYRISMSKWLSGTLVVLLLAFATVVNAQTTVDLSTHQPPAASTPSGATLEWHNAVPASAANLITGSAVTAAGTGIYYSVYHFITDGCYGAAAPLRVLSNVCPVTTADIRGAVDSANKPAGSIVTWHTATPANAANKMTPAAAAVATAGTYFVAYWDNTNNCYSNAAPIVVMTQSCCPAGTTAPSLSGTSLANICPVTTVDLTALHTGTIPSGTSLVWFSNSAHTGTAYATPTAATAGTYYAFYYDAVTPCYSPASSAVTVSITACCVAGSVAPPLH